MAITRNDDRSLPSGQIALNEIESAVTFRRDWLPDARKGTGGLHRSISNVIERKLYRSWRSQARQLDIRRIRLRKAYKANTVGLARCTRSVADCVYRFDRPPRRSWPFVRLRSANTSVIVLSLRSDRERHEKYKVP